MSRSAAIACRRRRSGSITLARAAAGHCEDQGDRSPARQERRRASSFRLRRPARRTPGPAFRRADRSGFGPAAPGRLESSRPQAPVLEPYRDRGREKREAAMLGRRSRRARRRRDRVIQESIAGPGPHPTDDARHGRQRDVPRERRRARRGRMDRAEAVAVRRLALAQRVGDAGDEGQEERERPDGAPLGSRAEDERDRDGELGERAARCRGQPRRAPARRSRPATHASQADREACPPRPSRRPPASTTRSCEDDRIHSRSRLAGGQSRLVASRAALRLSWRDA